MFISGLTEIEEFQTLKALRSLFPSLVDPSGDLHVMNQHLLRIVQRSREMPLRSLDADVELNMLCIESLHNAKSEVRNKLKAFIIACYTFILDKHPSPEIQQLKWSSRLPLKERYRDNEDFRIIFLEDEWENLLKFRNFLVLAVLVVKEKNKVLLEMAAGMLSNFNLCMSGGKPSRQVKRRHCIYHDETQTQIKPRRVRSTPSAVRRPEEAGGERGDGGEGEQELGKGKDEDYEDDYGSGSGGESAANRKRAKLDIDKSSLQVSLGVFPPKEPAQPNKLLMLMEASLLLAEQEHRTLLDEGYVGSFTEVISGIPSSLSFFGDSL